MVSRDHIDIERLKAFMLHNAPLAEEEHCHLSHCSQCVKAMASAALEALNDEKRAKNCSA